MVKVSDFGLSRETTGDEYQPKQGALLPVRWTAPEVLSGGPATRKSDVYRHFC